MPFNTDDGSLGDSIEAISYNSNRAHEYDQQLFSDINEASGSIDVPEYREPEANVIEWLQYVFANPVDKVKEYFLSLFPIAQWILHYNLKWLYGDLIAGITVGVVLVPQSMSYALLAGLEAQYGLYSSFVGVFIYSLFATSKDVSIGPVAVMSQQVGKVVSKVQQEYGDQYSAPEIATFLSLICGGIAAAIGLLRLGFILEFISIPAVMGFMSGSAFNILIGQVPGLMGYASSINTRSATYKVAVDTLKDLKKTNVNAAFGLVPLFLLYAWKYSTEYAQKRWPRQKLWFFYIQQLRLAIIIIVATAISWGIVHPKKVSFKGDKAHFKPPIQIIGNVPSGLKHVGVMTVPDGIIGAIASELPVSVIILLLEHIAISKSFGRVNDYRVNPNQEVVAIGVNNLIGTFFNAYPATGSFSRSALKSKCGVRTPLAGIFTGGVVLLALYCLTSAFYFIPKATLCAVIIHAVSDLIASYKVTWSFWKMAPLDCGIFVVAVIITVFASIEDGVYFAICASAAVLLFRIAWPKGYFLGKVRVAEVTNPVIDYSNSYNEYTESQSDDNTYDESKEIEIHQVLSNNSNYEAINPKKNGKEEKPSYNTTTNIQEKNPHITWHTKWVPLTKEYVNSALEVTPPPPGVIVYKPCESFTYPNASRVIDTITDEVKRITKRGKPYSFENKGDRPWNDPGPLKWNVPFLKKHDQVHEEKEDTRPLLKIIHLDFSTVAAIDVTSVQALVDLRKSVNLYADREVEFHFSGILSPWIKRGLINAGFGTYGEDLLSEKSYVNIATKYDLESNIGESKYYAATPTNTPFFHLEIPDY